MRLINVTRKSDGARMYVNPENICAVYSLCNDEDTTVIQFPGSDDNYLEVKESADTVARMMVRSDD